MGSYALIYTGGNAPTSPEEGAAVMTAWTAWFGSLGGAVVDPGNPFGPGATVRPDGTTAEGTGSGATGYSVVTAPDLAAAVAMAQACPHLSANGTVEVHEVHEVM